MLKRICWLIALLISGINLSAQEDSTKLPILDYSLAQKEYIIKKVTVSGADYTNPTVVISMSGLVVGKPITIPSEAISKIIEKFWNQGLYSDVKVVAKEIVSDSIWLEIQLKETRRLSSLTIKGVRKGEITDLKEKLGIRPGYKINENLLNNVSNIIKKHYREKGFFNTQVTFKQEDDTVYKNRVALTVFVDKKTKVKIRKIIINGNEQFTDKRLRRTLKKTKQLDFNIFKGSKFIESNFKEDKEKMHEFYKKNGFRDYRYISDSIKWIKDDRIILYINIFEGKKYYIRNISWIGNTKYPSEILGAYLMMKKGSVYDQVSLDKRLFIDEDAVSSLYMDNGYLFSSITPVEIPVGEDSIDLEMHVVEGRPANINKIIISGNDKTNEHVIRRELSTKPGDLFSKASIMRSIRYLNQLNYFNPEKIQPVPLPNPSDGTVDIQYNLEEKSSDQLEVSGGWGSGMLVGTLGLRFNNFSTRKVFDPKAWRPVPSGDGQSLSLRAQSNGSWYKSYSLGFTEPWLGGKKPNSFSFSLFYSVQNSSSTGLFSTSDQSFKVFGGSIGLGRRLKWPDNNFTLYNEISYQRYMLSNWSTGGFIFNDGSSQNFSFKTQFGRSTVDAPIYPRSGSQFSIALQITPPFSLFKKKNYWKLDLTPNEKSSLEQYVQDFNAEKVAANSVLRTSYEEEIYNREQSKKYKWIEYHKWTFKAAWYNKLYKDLVLSVNTQFGYLGYFSKNLGYSPFEGFVLGGDGFTGYSLYGKETIGLRGYENESLTPTKRIDYYANGNASYYNSSVANIYQKATVELRYPITLQPSSTVYALAFLEAGNSWYKFEQYNPFAMKRSAGVGIRIFLPMFGLLGIDWGYGFDPAFNQTTKSGGQFHFVMGQQF